MIGRTTVYRIEANLQKYKVTKKIIRYNQAIVQREPESALDQKIAPRLYILRPCEAPKATVKHPP